ncbi:MAG: LON peptidase substrate-binding domain-containing protein [Terriglobales bacterium]
MNLLPLFPLELVLFPDTPLPLHIFEPRYKEMIGECLSQKTPFGVVRAVEKGLAEVGCTAEIIEVTKKYDDGRLDILTEGRRRFEIQQIDQDRAFLRASVSYFDDAPGAASSQQLARAAALQKELLALAGARENANAVETDHPQLSFQLAAAMPLDLDFKQTLLGMHSEPERLKSVIEYYETLLPRMRRAVRARKTAGGNGHAI